MASEFDLKKLEASITFSKKDEIISRLEEENQFLKDKCNERTFAFIAFFILMAISLSFYFLPGLGASFLFVIYVALLVCAARRLGIEEFQQLVVWAIKTFKPLK